MPQTSGTTHFRGRWEPTARRLGVGYLALLEMGFHRYQITGLTDSGRTIGSPGLQPNAAANCGMFETGPLVLHCPGECESVLIRTRCDSGVMFCLQIWAHARKKRCSGVNPSMSGGLPFSARAFSSAA